MIPFRFEIQMWCFFGLGGHVNLFFLKSDLCHFLTWSSIRCIFSRPCDTNENRQIRITVALWRAFSISAISQHCNTAKQQHGRDTDDKLFALLTFFFFFFFWWWRCPCIICQRTDVFTLQFRFTWKKCNLLTNYINWHDQANMIVARNLNGKMRLVTWT